jgi:hypothetical protein
MEQPSNKQRSSNIIVIEFKLNRIRNKSTKENKKLVVILFVKRERERERERERKRRGEERLRRVKYF